MSDNFNKCTTKGCKNPCVRHYLKCAHCKQQWENKNNLLKDDFALSVGDINITSQGSKIVLTKREGTTNIKLLELDIEQALAVGIAIRSVATCVKYSKGE